MTEQSMTPREAADLIDRALDLCRGDDPRDRAMRVLVQHARDTSPAPEGGDLAVTVNQRNVWANDLRAVGVATTNPRIANRVDMIAQELDALAPAPSVATSPREGVCGSCRQTVSLVTESHMIGQIDGDDGIECEGGDSTDWTPVAPPQGSRHHDPELVDRLMSMTMGDCELHDFAVFTEGGTAPPCPWCPPAPLPTDAQAARSAER